MGGRQEIDGLMVATNSKNNLNLLALRETSFTVAPFHLKMLEEEPEKTAAAFWTSGDFRYSFANATMLFKNVENVMSHPNARKNSMFLSRCF